MITNERQYRISKTVLAKLRNHIERFRSANSGLQQDDVFHKAELETLESEDQIITEQLLEYEQLKAGNIPILEIDSLDELPTMLVKARIAQGLSQRALGERLRLKEQQIQRYESDKYASASLRRILEVATCLNLQLSDSIRVQTNPTDVTAQNTERGFLPQSFPVGEMYRRGWFEDFTGTLREAQERAGELLETYLHNIGLKRSEAMQRMHVRAQGSLDRYAYVAWECRILQLAQRTTLGARYSPASITTDWLRKLASLSARDDGPRLAVEYLANAGIPLVVEPHLPQTYLDGAAISATANR